MVVKHLLQKGWCEPASGKENSLPDCCEGVGVLLSEGGNTSAYLATERYRSTPFLPYVCHWINKPHQTVCRLGNNGKAGNLLVSPFAAIQSGTIHSLCLWMNGLETTLPSFAIHCNRHGNVITDATLER